MSSSNDQNRCTKRGTHERESKWSDVPIEIAELILKKLASIDILRFKVVCPSWNQAANSYIASPYYKPLPQSPWLVLGRDRTQEDDTCRFFSLQERKVYTIKNTLFEGSCVGASQGWLVIINKDYSALSLLNPVSGESIQLSDIRALGPVSYFSGRNILKAVLSSEPSRRNKFFLVICTIQEVAVVYKHEDETWSSLLVQLSAAAGTVFHCSKLFSLLNKNVVQVWNSTKSFHGGEIVYHRFNPGIRDNRSQSTGTCSWLMESVGELWRVTMSLDEFQNLFNFKVYKMNYVGTPATWERVENLGDRFIILCLHEAIALSASDFTEFEENSIYLHVECGIVVYNLQDRVGKPLCNPYESGGSRINRSPFLIVPSLSIK